MLNEIIFYFYFVVFSVRFVVGVRSSVKDILVINFELFLLVLHILPRKFDGVLPIFYLIKLIFFIKTNT